MFWSIKKINARQMAFQWAITAFLFADISTDRYVAESVQGLLTANKNILH